VSQAGGAIVIGAGLAGLTAAISLLEEGWQVEVIEARGRVGGRTWSKPLDSGAVIEMGAEFVLPGNTAVRELASGLGLDLWDKGVRYGNRQPRGDGFDDSSSDRAIADRLLSAVSTLESALACLPADDPTSAADLLASLDIDPEVRAVIVSRAEVSSARDAGMVPAAALAGLAHIDDEPSPSVAGGNQGLCLAMAERIGDRVRLDDPAVAVVWSEDSVEVLTASGHSASAARCVIAVPASVTNRIQFSPALPAEKTAAFEGVSYGHAAKLFVPLAEPAPVSATLNVPGRWWCWTETGAGDLPVPMVSCFAGSAAALERLELTSGSATWLAELERLRPDLPLQADEAVLSKWDDDPWIQAAYSVSPSRELTSALLEPVGPFAFAGEHTAGEFSGLMEGAVRSGRTAADRLVRTAE